MRIRIARAVALVISASLGSLSAANENSASNAPAASAVQSISVPAGELREALKSLARQTSSNLVFRPEQMDGLRTEGVSGMLSMQEALAVLLKGTVLEVNQDERTGAILIAAPKGEGKPVARGAERDEIRVAEGDEAAQGETGRKGEGEVTQLLDEIVVTAQKREERLKEVPISISVLSGADLDKSSLIGMGETLRRIPGLDLFPQGGSIVGLTMRSVTYGTGTRNVVGYYLDSVPFGYIRQSYLPDPNVYDLERVEVLRGPQGTLYGASALAGVIRILTKNADTQDFDLKIRGSLGSVKDGSEDYKMDASVNIPLIPGKLGARLVGGYQNLGGWVDKPDRQDANSLMSQSLRAKLRATLSDRLTLDASAWFYRSDLDSMNLGNTGRTTVARDNESDSHDYDAFGFVAAYAWPFATLTSSSSYIDYDIDSDLSWMPLGLNTLQFGSYDSRVLAQEVSLASAGTGSWRWNVGAMYRNAKDNKTRDFDRSLLVPLPNPILDIDDDSESFAIFGELTQLFAEGRWEATVGLRHFQDRVVTAENFSVTNIPGAQLIRAADKFDALTPRFVLTWHPVTRATVYASYSEGFRSGMTQTPETLSQLNTTEAAALRPLRPDKLKNYELGAKSSFFDGRLDFDTAIYFMDWRDIQTTLTIPIFNNGTAPYIFALTNGESASGPGVDYSVTVRPAEGLALTANGSWTDLTFDASVLDPASGALVFEKGEHSPGSVKYTYGFAADYAFPLGSRGWNAIVSGYMGRRFIPNTYGTFAVPEYKLTTSSARLTIESGESWSAGLFIDNVLDDDNPNWPRSYQDWGPRLRPRTIGLQFEYLYGRR